MKKIIILSDTHGNLNDLKKLTSLLEEADLILFAGDGVNDFSVFPLEIYKKIKMVSGNCDFSSVDRELIFEVEKKRIMLCHGDRYRVKSGLMPLFLHAKEVGCDVVVYGHTHDARIDENEGILFINPGTLYRYSMKSFCYLVISGDKAVATINDGFFNK